MIHRSRKARVINYVQASIALFLLLSSCGLPDQSNRVIGTYELVARHKFIPTPDVRLELTDDKAILHTGSSEVTSEYEVTNSYVYLTSSTGRVAFRIVNQDTLRVVDAMGNLSDYVRRVR